MYTTIIHANVAGIFRELNNGNYEPVLSGFGASFAHWFVGDSALSGLRTSMPATRAWYEQLCRSFPDIRFQVQATVVSGWPWNTQVGVESTDSYTLLNGATRINCGAHLIRLAGEK